MTTYGEEISGFEKNENVEEIYSSSTESVYKVSKPFAVDDYEFEEDEYIYECNSFNRAYSTLDELALCDMAEISIEAKKELGLIITLKDLARLVQQRERDLTPGSETTLLGCFVNEYDYVQKILDNETDQDTTRDMTDHYISWEKAYNKMEKFEGEGIDYSIDMLF